MRGGAFYGEPPYPEAVVSDELTATSSALKGGLEDEIRCAPPDVRERCRQERSRPQIEDLRVAIDNALRRLSPKSAMAQALAYGRRRWEALTRFLDVSVGWRPQIRRLRPPVADLAASSTA